VRILLLIGVIVAVDRATKEIAVRKLASSGRGFLRVVANGRPLLGRGPSVRALVMLWVAAIGCALVALMCAPALRANPLVTAGIVAALAGASGNLGDRLVRGAVVDFIAIGRWPAFNLADVAIVAGAALVGASLI
jgi:lipoprotein signal peptidase